MNGTKMGRMLFLSALSIVTVAMNAMEKERAITTRAQQSFYPEKGPRVLENAENAGQSDLTALKGYVARDKSTYAKIKPLNLNQDVDFSTTDMIKRYPSKYAKPLAPSQLTEKNKEVYMGNLNDYYTSFDDFSLATESPHKKQNRLVRQRTQRTQRKSVGSPLQPITMNYGNVDYDLPVNSPEKQPITRALFPGELGVLLHRSQLEQKKERVISDRFDIVEEQEILNKDDEKSTRRFLGIRKSQNSNNING